MIIVINKNLGWQCRSMHAPGEFQAASTAYATMHTTDSMMQKRDNMPFTGFRDNFSRTA